MTEDDTFEALRRPLTEDEIAFGRNRFVYCKQHLRPHLTGWCTVNNNEKVLLDAMTPADARAECNAKMYKLWNG